MTFCRQLTRIQGDRIGRFFRLLGDCPDWAVY
jgi:hypothetical protein